MLAIAATVVMTPLVHSWQTTPLKVPGTLLELIPVLVYELSAGLAMGLAVTVLMGGLEVAGNMLSQLSGLSMADVFDPSSGTSVPLYGRLMRLVATAVVVASGGYRLMFDALMDSFTWMPPGGATAPGEVALSLVEVLGMSFTLGVRAASPVVLALLLGTLIIALIGRALPQLNVLAVGFNLNVTIVLLVMTFAMGAMVFMYQDHVHLALREIQRVYYEQATQAAARASSLSSP